MVHGDHVHDLVVETPQALEFGALQALLSMGDLPPEGGPSSRQ